MGKFEKGHEKVGGREKNVPNKATADARAAIGKFVDDNAGRLQDWLDRIATKDPEKAFSLFQSVIEYHVPKLQRSEQQFLDKEGQPADASLTVRYVE